MVDLDWQTVIMVTGLAGKSVATDFIEPFRAYYLSEKTFLGRCQRGCDCKAENLLEQCQLNQCGDAPTSTSQSCSTSNNSCCG